MPNNLKVKTAIIFGWLLGTIFAFHVVTANAQPGPWLELPAIPSLPESVQAADLNEDLLLNGIKAKILHYRTSLSSEEVKQFYARHLRRRGWRYKGEHEEGIPYYYKQGLYLYVLPEKYLRGLYHHLDEQNLALLKVYLKSGDSSFRRGTDVYLCVSKKKVYLCRGLDPKIQPASDIPGDDPTDIPRYPYAKRRMDVERVSHGGGLVIYETKDDVEQIKNFYQQRMADYGWQLAQVVNLNEVYMGEYYDYIPVAGSMEKRARTGYRLFYAKPQEKFLVIAIAQNCLLDSRLISVHY